MKVHTLAVPDVVVITPRRFDDERGSFREWFRADILQEATGRSMPVAQANVSVSARGVVRGLHFADVPLGQAKYVSVLSGAVMDYVIDLRAGSPDFGKWDMVELSADNGRAIFVPEGFGHAFLALHDNTVVSYLVSDIYRPTHEHAITPLDPQLGLDFSARGDAPLIVAPRDSEAPTLSQAAHAGLLPSFESCRRRYEELRASPPG